jgi:hypothetical protein
VGSLGGVVLRWHGWRGVALMVSGLLVLALVAGFWLRQMSASERLASTRGRT